MTNSSNDSSSSPLLPDMMNEMNYLASDPEMKTMLKRMQEIKEECELKLQEIYKKSHLSANQIQAKLNEMITSNQEMIELETSRKKLENELKKIFGSDAKLGELETKEHKDQKIRKSKTRGARNKWIPM